MLIRYLLIVNDDVEDAIRIKKQLCDKNTVEIASQAQTQYMSNFPYQLIILDNDANDLKEAKGPKTLEHIREKNPDCPIVFTSFQPSWVNEEVKATQEVRVVRTDKLLEVLNQEFEMAIQPLPKYFSLPETNSTIIVTYNHVVGYPEGVYRNGKLIILSYDKLARDKAQQILKEKLQKIYKQFEWRADRDRIKNIFVYDGINGGEWPARMASALGHDVRMKVQLVACGCDWQRKVRTANADYVDLYKVECGGSRTLGMIADMILGIKRPNQEYDRVFIPPRIFEKGAEKYRI